MIRSLHLSFIAFLFLAAVCRAEELARASESYRLSFPRDHGVHRNFETEWWYFTGHLVSEGRRIFFDPSEYGFQLTFFRRRAAELRAVRWQHDYLAHGALSIVKDKRFLYEKLVASGGLEVAGAADDTLRVWNRGWSAEMTGEEISLSYSLNSERGVTQVSLSGARPAPLLHGKNGFSKKGGCDTCASMYYSLPRIPLKGTITLNGEERDVHGVGWYDHEFMTNVLQENQEGWDWVSIMLEDGAHMMVFRVRGKNGSPDYLSATLSVGTETLALSEGEFEFTPLGERWRSKISGGMYPLNWKVVVPSKNISLELAALFSEQELGWREGGGITYWEGAAGVSGSHRGVAYLEMTGYGASISSAF